MGEFERMLRGLGGAFPPTPGMYQQQPPSDYAIAQQQMAIMQQDRSVYSDVFQVATDRYFQAKGEAERAKRRPARKGPDTLEDKPKAPRPVVLWQDWVMPFTCAIAVVVGLLVFL